MQSRLVYEGHRTDVSRDLERDVAPCRLPRLYVPVGVRWLREIGRLLVLETAEVFIDVLTNLERIGDLANNVGYAIRGDLSKL